MDVHEFEKSLLQRMEESCNVLQCKGSPVPASDVREEWACHVELKIEPAGWQAIWKINRATCEQYQIKYPTMVLGTVNNVYFQDLMADFSISMVQDDDVHLPEIHEVPLEDLWPTIDQENSELNIERTADCIDELRFFYRNVWMPWDKDSDDEADWCKKHLESRIRFCFDLKRDMSRGMADHIRKLLSEARYIQDKREIMELEIDDDEELEEDPQKVEAFLRMQLRMLEIRNEIGMLEDPLLRKTYENIHFKSKSNNNDSKYDQKANVYIVTKEGTITAQMEYLDAAKKSIGADEVVKFVPSLKDCLKESHTRDQIYLPSGQHSIKLLEPLNSGGLLKAVSTVHNNKANIVSNFSESKYMKSVITTKERDNVFLSFNGDYTIENVILDCRQVRFGIWIKGGTVTLKNCQLIGDKSSSTGIGIVVAGDAKCVLENTSIHSVATGVTCAAGGTFTMNQSSLSNCGTGLDIEDTSNVQITSSQLTNNDYGIFYRTKADNLFGKGEKKKIVSEFEELRKLSPSFAFSGDCSFSDNKKGNIAIVDQKNMVSLQHSEYLEENYDESGFKTTDVSMSNGKMPNMANGESSLILVDDDDDDADVSCSFSKDCNNQNYHHNSIAEISIISID